MARNGGSWAGNGLHGLGNGTGDMGWAWEQLEEFCTMCLGRLSAVCFVPDRVRCCKSFLSLQSERPR